MTRAYDKTYLEKTRILLGRMLDFAVHDLHYSVEDFYLMFLKSKFPKEIEKANPSVLVGKSGVELAYDIIGNSDVEPIFRFDKSPEYWAGWALAYYEWYTSLSFDQINEFISISDIISMYPKYHEMDIMQFVDKLNELYQSKHQISNLKKKRLEANLSQSELSKLSLVPLRTIQQYEQRVKNINNAKVESVIMLSRALSCEVIDIIELV